MTTISFKAENEFKELISYIAVKKGINMSAYIKLILKKAVNEDLSEMTENGLTVAEEMRILQSEESEECTGPFTNSEDLKMSLLS